MHMDEREAMAVSGSSYYHHIHRGGRRQEEEEEEENVGLNSPSGGFGSLMGTALLGQSCSSDHRNNTSQVFVDHQQGNLNAPSGGLKKKRGRPRKYHGVSLGLSPSTGSLPPTQKKGRGRPPGSGRKQQLASLGGWMNTSAGQAFAPHVIFIAIGEDIAAKIMAFAVQKPRALCIMSASGKVSAVTLQQPVSGTTARYEGHFEILCLSGSYLVAENGPHKRNGGLNVSLCSPEGHVFGGSVGGMLIASSPVQVVVCTFVYGGSKPMENSGSYAERSMSQQPAESEANQSPNSRRMNRINTHAGIDLAHG